MHQTEEQLSSQRIMLDQYDEAWLGALGGHIEQDDGISRINDLIELGSKDLRSDTDPDTEQAVLNARQEFLGSVLGWDAEDSDFHSTLSTVQKAFPKLLSPATVISGMRECATAGIDVARVVKKNPGLLSYDGERIHKRIGELADVGVEPKKVIEAYPRVLGLASETLERRIANLTQSGIDAPRAIDKYGALLGYDEESLREKINSINELGLDASKIADTFPQVLGANATTFRTKVYALMKHGYLTEGGEGVREFSDNEAFVKKFVMMPGESLLLYLQTVQVHDPNTLAFLPDRATDFMKRQGYKTSQERIEAFESELPALRESMGYLALLQAMRNGTLVSEKHPLVERSPSTRIANS